LFWTKSRFRASVAREKRQGREIDLVHLPAIEGDYLDHPGARLQASVQIQIQLLLGGVRQFLSGAGGSTKLALLGKWVKGLGGRHECQEKVQGHGRVYG
jgi:hypothetical protein